MQGKPLELFRMDYISAMKLPDGGIVDGERVYRVSDPWRHEWNNGVQIPAGHEEGRDSLCSKASSSSGPPRPAWKAPKKLVRLSKDGDWDASLHAYSGALKKAEETCRYDLDEVDAAWLSLANAQRRSSPSSSASVELAAGEMERVMERLESDVYEGVQKDLEDRAAYARGREFEEDSVCDVCWMPDSSDENEMVFCDRCDLAVHQVCYGTGPLPSGSWLCRACAISPSAPPHCCLCPNKGGALKCTRSAQRWAHVSCVWWIPEVRFEDTDNMEPVVHIARIPADRWNLKCAVCGKREGACIQCSAHKCPTAYHVTCAQMSQPAIHMRWLTGDDAEDGGVQLLSFCRKHSATYLASHAPAPSPHASPTAPSSSAAPLNASISYSRPSISGRTHDSPLKRKLKRQALLEASFFSYVDVSAVAKSLELPRGVVEAVFEYWKLKRRSRGNESLMTPKVEEELILEKRDREVLMRKVKIFVALRQNLEKARNLCYMVQKRERLKRQYVALREAGLQTAERLLSLGAASSARELDKLALSLGPTNAYEASGLCADDSALPPPSSPPRLSPQPALPASPASPSSSRQPPKTLVHLKRLPTALSPGPDRRRSWPLPPPSHVSQKNPIVLLQCLEPSDGGRISHGDAGRLGRKSLESRLTNGHLPPPPKRARLSSALAPGPIRRSANALHPAHQHL